MIFQTMYQMGPEQERLPDMLDQPDWGIPSESLEQQLAQDEIRRAEDTASPKTALEEIRAAIDQAAAGPEIDLANNELSSGSFIPVGNRPFESGTGWTDLADLDRIGPEAALQEIRDAIDEAVADAYLGIPPDWLMHP